MFLPRGVRVGDGVKGLWSPSLFSVAPLPHPTPHPWLGDSRDYTRLFRLCPKLSWKEQAQVGDNPDSRSCLPSLPLDGFTAFHRWGLGCSSGRGWGQNPCQVGWKQAFSLSPFFCWGLPLGVLGGGFPCGSLGSREGLLASSLRSGSHSAL